MRIFEKEILLSPGNNWDIFQPQSQATGANDITAGSFFYSLASLSYNAFSACLKQNQSGFFSNFINKNAVENSPTIGTNRYIRKAIVFKNQTIETNSTTYQSDIICAITKSSTGGGDGVINTYDPVRTFDNSQLPSGYVDINDIACNSNYVYVVGSPEYIAYSTDGATFNNLNLASGVTIPTNAEFTSITAFKAGTIAFDLTAIAWGRASGNVFAAYINNDTITSIEGVPITITYLPTVATINKLTVGIQINTSSLPSPYGGNRTVIFDGSYHVLDNLPAEIKTNLKAKIKALGDTFYVFNDTSNVFKTKDGRTWTTETVGDLNWISGAILENSICLISEDGFIAQKRL